MSKGKDLQDLSEENLQILSKVKRITNVELMDDWEDDHENCIRLKFKVGKKKWDLNFWWIDSEYLAHATYAYKDAGARKKLAFMIRLTAKDELAMKLEDREIEEKSKREAVMKAINILRKGR